MIDNDSRNKLNLIRFGTAHSSSKRQYVKLIEKLYSALKEERSFHEGMIVTWKPNLKNKSFLNYNQPAIITDVLDDPIYDITDYNVENSHFREPLTICIGSIINGEFGEFYVDGRRFESYLTIDE